MTEPYGVGTVTVVNGGTTVTGTSTFWVGKVRKNDLFTVPAQGLFARITADPTENDELAINAWPGDALVDAEYEIISTFIAVDTASRTRELLLGLSLIDPNYDVQVDTLSARAAYDDKPGPTPTERGFAVLVSDIGDGRSAIYSKVSNASADWSDAAYFSGPIGETPEVTVGTVTTGAPGTDAEVTATPITGGVELDFTIPAGEGFIFEGAYSGATAYAKGDVVRDAGSSWMALQATTGNAPPTLPTTSNAYWELLAQKGQDGTGTGDVVGPATVTDNRVAVYDGATGKLLKDGGKTIAQILAEAAPAGYDDLQFTVSQLALAMADALNIAQFLGSNGNRLADSFDTLIYVDVAGATNLDTGAAGLLKPTIAVSDTLSAQTFTNDGAGFAGATIKQLIGAGVLTTSGSKVRVSVQASASGMTLSGLFIGHRDPGGDGWDALTLTPVTFFGQSSLVLGANQIVASDWITFSLDETKDVILSFHVSANDFKTIPSGLNASNFVRNFKASVNEAGTANASGYTATTGRLDFIRQIEVQTGVNNLTVRSASFTAASVPTKMKALINVKEVDAAVAGTDYTLECSRDGGTTWTAITLTERYTLPTAGLRVVEAAETDVSGQPSGTAPRWRFKTLNNKNVELHDVYLYWS